MSFDFEKWASERFQGMTHMERNAVETELVVREFRPLIEAARGRYRASQTATMATARTGWGTRTTCNSSKPSATWG